jgi:hypothetical protein
MLQFSQPHRPRGAEGGRQHKKRVRQPHNTRERQKQVAMGQGEYLMPEVNPYSSSKVRTNSIAANANPVQFFLAILIFFFYNCSILI